MAEATGNTLPWTGFGKREEETTSETTSGGEEPIRWVAVGVNLNPGEAAIIRARLESEKIPAIVQQEAFGSFIGLTVGPLGSAQVLVPEPLVERALSILAETYELTEEDEAGWDEEFPDDFEE